VDGAIESDICFSVHRSYDRSLQLTFLIFSIERNAPNPSMPIMSSNRLSESVGGFGMGWPTMKPIHCPSGETRYACDGLVADLGGDG